MMTNLDHLIAKLCPNGVEFAPIKALADIGTGRSDRVNAVEDGKYPFYVRSKTIFRSNRFLFDEEAIVIPGEGGIGDIFHFVQGKYDLHQRAYRICFTKSFVDTKYAYYYFAANFKKFIMMKAVSATVTSIRKPMIEDFLIAVPPLPVQREIVRILDNFTELTARKKQYNYYRDELLTFDNNVPVVMLGEIYESSSGLSKGADDFGFGSPFLSFKTVFNNPIIPNEIIDLVNTTESEQLRYSIKKGDVFVTRTSESLEELGMSCAALDDYPKATFNGFTKRLRPKEIDKVNPQFAAYFFRSSFFRTQIARMAVLSTRVSLNDSILLKIKMPLPTLDEQARVVSILNRFNELTTDITCGLPAEISARQRQYEYYRDKLLNFEGRNL